MSNILERKKILIVEDEWQTLHRFAKSLRDEGAVVVAAETVKAALAAFTKANFAFDVVLIDMYLPLSAGQSELPGAGIGLADSLLERCAGRPKGKRPMMIGMSGYTPDFSREALSLRFDAFFDKFDELRERGLVSFITSQLQRPQREFRLPKIFIVHGHDDRTKLELKNYLQNYLRLGEPIILHERPDVGRTIVEKFEGESADVDIVFVLLTPDDRAAAKNASNSMKRRARQNVIFEMGYFYGALKRRTGRVIVLKRGGLEIPSDISGLVFIDISKGLLASGEMIRKELSPWLQDIPTSGLRKEQKGRLTSRNEKA